MDQTAKQRRWLPHRFSWGPIPSSRHSAISWASGPFFYVYGGVLEALPTNTQEEQSGIHQLDTRSMTWKTIQTTGTPPPFDFRARDYVFMDGSTLHNLVPEFNMQAQPPINAHTGLPNRPITSVSLFSLNTTTWVWSQSITKVGGVPYGMSGHSLVRDPAARRIGVAFGLYSAGHQINHSVGTLNLDTLSWTAIYMNSGRSGFTGGTWELVDGNWYYFGGRQYQITHNSPAPKGTTAPIIDGWVLQKVDHKGTSMHGFNLTTDPFPQNLIQGGHSTCVVGRKVIVICGEEVYLFDPSKIVATTAVFEPQEFLNPGRKFCSMTPIGDRLFIFGGISDKVCYNDVRVLQLDKSDTTMTWQEICEQSIPVREKPETLPPLTEIISSVGTVPPATQPTVPDISIQIPNSIFPVCGSGSWSGSGSSDSEDSSEKAADKPVPIRFVKAGVSPPSPNLMSAPTKPAFAVNTGDDTPAYCLPFLVAANNKDYYPDVEFKLGKKSFYGHKVVLCTASQVFSKLFDPKSAAARFGKGKKAEEGSESLSQWGDAEEMTIQKVPDFFNPAAFLQILNFLYTGYLVVKNQQNASELSEVAFEYLLDDVMQFCDGASVFPCFMQEPEDELLKRYRNLVGHAVGSDVSFVFNRKERLLSHKVFLSLFSDHFRKELQSNPKRKYIEISNSNINSKAFSHFLKMLYTGFSPNSLRPSINHADLLFIAIQYRERSLLEALSFSTSFDNKNFCIFWKQAKEFKLVPLIKACDRYLETHLSKIVRDSFVFENWDKELLDRISQRLMKPYEDWCYYASWLDILWFSHHAKVSDLKSRAVKALEPLLNVENVVSVLVASHTTGEKQLRSVCVDFIVANGVNVSAYQSMKNNQEHGINKITDLSSSLKQEVEGKVIKTVGSLSKLPQAEKVKTGFLGKKKQTCTLCKRTMKKEDLSKQLLPPVLAGGRKFKIVCNSCNQLADLVGGVPPPKDSN